MAVFTSTRELATQRQTKNFKSQTGWKAVAMNMLGYKASGEKNWFGKYVGGVGIGKNLAAKQLGKGSDAEEVIGSQTDAELEHQMGTAKFAMNFVGGGGGMDFMGGSSGGAGASQGASGSATGGGMFPKAGQGTAGKDGGGTWMGGQINKFGGGGGAAQGSSGESILDNKIIGGDGSMTGGESGKKLADDIVANGKQKTIEEMSDEAILAMNENEYTNDSTEAGQKDADLTNESSQTKDWGKVSKATDSIPIVGEFAGLYTQKMEMADAYKRKAHSMFNQKTTRGTDAYFE